MTKSLISSVGDRARAIVSLMRDGSNYYAVLIKSYACEKCCKSTVTVDILPGAMYVASYVCSLLMPNFRM